MRLRLLTVAALLGLALPASASEPATVSCNYRTVQPHGETEHVGYLYGYIASAVPDEHVSVRCVFYVDGVEVASTPTGEGTTVATTAATFHYTATDTQWTLLCAEYSAGADSNDVCYDNAWFGFPPQELCDLVTDVTFGHVEPDCLWW